MEGRRKEILLLIVAACALAVALITFLGKGSTPPPPPPPAPLADAAAGTAAEAGDEAEGAADGAHGGADSDAQRDPFSGVATTPSNETTDAATVADPEPPSEGVSPSEGSLTLTGIVAGKPSLAIVRHDGQRYYVKAGEHIGDQYRVQRIGRNEVILAGPAGTVTLRMGGRQ